MRRCSPRAGAGWPAPLSRYRGMRGGKKVPPQLARMEAEDLIGTVFPDQLACAENLVGEREIPDHPLVNQTIADCLNDAMDVAGLERLLGETGGGRDPRGRARSDAALAARPRGAIGKAVRLSGRCAARGTPNAGGHEPALARPGNGVRYRPARSGGDRPRPGGSLARPGECRRIARCAGVARLPRCGAKWRRGGLERVAAGARAGEPGNSATRTSGRNLDRRRAARPVSGVVARCEAGAGDRACPPPMPTGSGRARTR